MGRDSRRRILEVKSAPNNHHAVGARSWEEGKRHSQAKAARTENVEPVRGLDTISEQLFVTFCAQRGIRCVPVATASTAAQRRPDFQLIGNRGTTIIAEVKQFDPSPD